MNAEGCTSQSVNGVKSIESHAGGQFHHFCLLLKYGEIGLRHHFRLIPTRSLIGWFSLRDRTYRRSIRTSVNPCPFCRFWIFSNVINPMKASFSSCSNKFPKLCRPKKNNFWYSIGMWRRRQWRLFSRNLLLVWSLKFIIAPGVNFRKIESGTYRYASPIFIHPGPRLLLIGWNWKFQFCHSFEQKSRTKKFRFGFEHEVDHKIKHFACERDCFMCLVC